MRVAVVGAGPSGLVAVKELLEEGHDVVCFEGAPDIGGVYRFDVSGNGVWESCRLTSSALITTFSDFPPPRGASLHFTHSEYLLYLASYCEHFELRKHIRFGHVVERVRRGDGGTWSVTVRQGGDQQTHSFDAVAVCSGLHQTPYMPELPGRHEFQGEILHASSYKSARPFAGSRVVVVGVGESGADIAAEVAAVASECVLSMRQEPYVFRRLIRGFPNDYYTTRLRYSLPQWAELVENPRPLVRRRRAALDTLTLPLSLLVRVFDSLEKRARRARLSRSGPEGATEVQVERTIEAFRARSGGGPAEQFATKSESFVHALLDGSCESRAEVAGFTSSGVRLTDGTTCDADFVVFCTGYHPSFPFLDVDVSDARKLFKQCFDVETGPTLGLIGLVRPGIGSIPPISELQARWFALLCAGRRALPDEASMRDEVRRDGERHREQFPRQSDRLPYLVDYTSYMDDLAARVGCKPRFRDLLLQPRAARAVYTGPFSAHQYRLRGPHAKVAVVASVFAEFPRAQPLRRIVLQVLSIGVCKALAALGFSRFRPHLSLSSR